MGAAGKLGAFPGAKPDKKNSSQASRASFAATSAADRIAKEEKMAPVARPQVRRPDVGGTALAAIGKHPTLNLKQICSGKPGQRKAALLSEAMTRGEVLSRTDS
jgi:hypothetical protein